MTDATTPDFMTDSPEVAPEVPATEPTAPPPATEPKPEKPPVLPAEPDQTPATPEAHQVPLATFLDQREQMAALKKEAEDLRAWKQQQEQRARQQPVPDRNAQPDEYDEYIQSQVQARVRAVEFNASKRFAELSHGKEAVDAAFQWGVAKCDEDALFNQKVATAADPMELVVAEWKREQTLSKIGDSDRLEAFLAWEASQQNTAGQPPQSTQANRVQPAAPRASIASAPSAGRNGRTEPMTGEGTFNQMFGG